MKKIICIVVVLVLLGTVLGTCAEKEALFAQVEALNIQCREYTLCAPLSLEQQAHARDNMEEAGSGKVYRFKDGHLNIVADQKTHRVLVMFEQFEDIGQQDVQKLVGDLFFNYGEPTVSAHDKVVYWAWGEKNKYTAAQYEAAKEKEKQLKIIATVKLNSEVKIRENNADQSTGDIYYIISSDPLLGFFKEN